MMLVKGPEFPGPPKKKKSSGLLDTFARVCLHVWGSWVCLGVFLHECGRVSAHLCVCAHARGSELLKSS